MNAIFNIQLISSYELHNNHQMIEGFNLSPRYSHRSIEQKCFPGIRPKYSLPNKYNHNKQYSLHDRYKDKKYRNNPYMSNKRTIVQIVNRPSTINTQYVQLMPHQIYIKPLVQDKMSIKREVNELKSEIKNLQKEIIQQKNERVQIKNTKSSLDRKIYLQQEAQSEFENNDRSIFKRRRIENRVFLHKLPIIEHKRAKRYLPKINQTHVPSADNMDNYEQKIYYHIGKNNDSFQSKDLSEYSLGYGRLKHQKLKLKTLPNIITLTKPIKRSHFRKIVHVVLFTIYLRKFNETMRNCRIKHFADFVKIDMKKLLIEMKNTLIDETRPLLKILLSAQFGSLTILETDLPIQKVNKISKTKQLAQFQIEQISKAINRHTKNNKMIELCYLLCKHGSYICGESLSTSEQLDLMCISEVHFYLRADKYLEKSCILGLFWIKLGLFNVMLQPNRLQIEGEAGRNMITIGNVIYELLIDIQDSLLQQAGEIYKIGNWIHLTSRYDFKKVPYMTVKQGLKSKNQLISGLTEHRIVQQTYETAKMVKEKDKILNSINSLHRLIIQMHQDISKRYFF